MFKHIYIALKAEEITDEANKKTREALILQFIVPGGPGEEDQPDVAACKNFLNNELNEFTLTTLDAKEYLFQVRPYHLESNQGVMQHLAQVLLPAVEIEKRAEIRKVLEQYLELKYPVSFIKNLSEYSQSKAEQKNFILQIKDKMINRWEDFKHHSVVANTKRLVQENAVSKFFARKLGDFFTWFNQTTLGKKVQEDLVTLRQRKESILRDYQEKKAQIIDKLNHYKTIVNQKLALIRAWRDYIIFHVKNYFTQVAREPRKWGKNFAHLPSRYPGVLSTLITGSIMGLFCGVKIVGYSALAGGCIFVATHLRNYLYEQQYLSIDRSRATFTPKGEEDPQKMKDDAAYVLGKAAGKDWLAWSKSWGKGVAWTAWLNVGAGMHESVTETIQAHKQSKSKTVTF